MPIFFIFYIEAFATRSLYENIPPDIPISILAPENKS